MYWVISWGLNIMSNYDVFKPGKLPVYMFTKGVPVEEEVYKQLTPIAELPFVYKHIAVMPDCHVGKGSTIGCVIPTLGAIIPAAVGVDLGCGMAAIRTSIKTKHLPDSLADLRFKIENAVPHGRTNNGHQGDRGAWHNIPEDVAYAWIGKKFEERYKLICQKHTSIDNGRVNHINHLGTLGTGNHFIELCSDEENFVWVVLHSGSRGVGHRLASYFIEKAQSDMKKWFINLPDDDLAYIPEGATYFQDYIEAVQWAQDYALTNRSLMMDAVLEILAKEIPLDWTSNEIINCHHNYVEKENHYDQNLWITRKGAVRARTGDMGIIPGSMGTGSFIVRGKGNKESFDSCSHGAGRQMSRKVAKKTISLEQHKFDTAGVECRKDAEVLDESPRAYKSLGAVMAAQGDLVEIVHKLTTLLCVKG